MDRLERITNFLISVWPGLPRLWRQGSTIGLMESLTFAMLLQVAIVTTVIWPETIGAGARPVVWFCVAVYWLIFAAPAVWQATRVLAGSFSGDTLDRREGLFQQAQREYLRGEWFISENLLTELLELDAGDSEARLLLATLHRHAGRWQAAKEELDRLDTIPSGETWRFEVLQERLALVRWKRRRAHDAENEDGVDGVAIDAA